MSDFVQIKHNESLKRDLSNNGIISNNLNEYNNYLLRKLAKKQEHCKIEAIENEISCLRNDLNEIKQLLLQFHK